MSGAGIGDRGEVLETSPSRKLAGYDHNAKTGWSSIRGQSMGSAREAKVLVRNRLKVGVYTANGERLSSEGLLKAGTANIHAMNEV